MGDRQITIKYCRGDYNQLTKYCNDSYYGYNGFTDNLTTLLPEDDAAMANWGNGWSMPTCEQWEELYQNTTQEWTTQNGVNGCRFTSGNGNSLFLPSAGYCWDDVLKYAGYRGYYRSSSLIPIIPDRAWEFFFYSGIYGMDSGHPRGYGLPVRPVRSARQN